MDLERLTAMAVSFCNFATGTISSLETRGFVKKTNTKVHGNTHALDIGI